MQYTGYLVYRDRFGEYAEEIDVEATNSFQATATVEAIAKTDYAAGYDRIVVRHAVTEVGLTQI